jgi:transposase InsO family protein
MRAAGLRGVIRAKSPRTTRPAPEIDRPADLVERQFTATTPNQLWVADITYIRTFSGWVYAAFVIDVFSRLVVGWQVATSLYTDLALDALEMAIWKHRHTGGDLSGLVHHSDRGVQYRAIRYTDRLAEADAVASVGSRGDSYDNALAEAFNSLFKAELIRNKGPVGTAARSPLPAGRARARGARPAGTSRRSPRPSTDRPADRSPTSPSCRADCSPARPARSETEPAHRNRDGGTTSTSTMASAFETAPSMPTDHAVTPENSRSPPGSSSVAGLTQALEEALEL